jgi:hypothetical protein
LSVFAKGDWNVTGTYWAVCDFDQILAVKLWNILAGFENHQPAATQTQLHWLPPKFYKEFPPFFVEDYIIDRAREFSCTSLSD